MATVWETSKVLLFIFPFFFLRKSKRIYTNVKPNFIKCSKGIEEKAEYFKDIGVDCVWLSPIFKSPMADFGYDISDYNQIDRIYGTIEDFVSLQKKLKSLGNYRNMFLKKKKLFRSLFKYNNI